MIATIYARYSDDKQRPTSIEDQVRRCSELAEQNGLTVGPTRVITDFALSGQEKDLKKREGYQALMAAWGAGSLDVVVVDELSRLARDGVELALLQKRIEKTGVRLLTGSGIDTSRPNWQLQFGLESLTSQNAGRETRHRVGRGMLGQLIRGYNVGYPPFGYRMQQYFGETGKKLGTKWHIQEDLADIVREIYAMRRAGSSFAKIAAMLNTRGILLAGKAKTEMGGYWRPARVRALIHSPVYRGEVSWHDSAFFKDKARKTRQKREEQFFERPDLRIVDDETWYACNKATLSRSGYGGGKNLFAGLVTCSVCKATLSVGNRRAPSLSCAQCSQAKMVGVAEPRLTGSIAVSGVEFMLDQLLRELLAGSLVKQFRERLQAKLMAGPDTAIVETERQLAEVSKIVDRLETILASDTGDNDTLASKYLERKNEQRQLQRNLARLKAGAQTLNREVVAKQLSVDPVSLLPSLFDGSQEVECVRAMLARLFPKILFLGKFERYVAGFEIH